MVDLATRLTGGGAALGQGDRGLAGPSGEGYSFSLLRRVAEEVHRKPDLVEGREVLEGAVEEATF